MEKEELNKEFERGVFRQKFGDIMITNFAKHHIRINQKWSNGWSAPYIKMKRFM